MDRWLEKLHGRSDLIAKLALLLRHLDETAADGKDQELIEDLFIKNTVDDPFSLLRTYLYNGDDQRERSESRAREEAEWVAAAWQIPWERARQVRILGQCLRHKVRLQNWLFSYRKNLGLLPDSA